MTTVQSSNNDQNKYDKIGGWLILCAVGLLLYPVQTTLSLITDIIPALSENSRFLLTSPDSSSYHPLWGPLLMMELVGSICFLIFSVIVIVCFFARRKFLPTMAIVFIVLNLIFVGVDYYLARAILMKTDPVHTESLVNFIRTLVASAIWVCYFLYSKRVKRTFSK